MGVEDTFTSLNVAELYSSPTARYRRIAHMLYIKSLIGACQPLDITGSLFPPV